MSDDADPIVLPLIAEDADIARRSVVTGRVVVTTHTTTDVVAIDEELAAESVVVERVPIRRFVDQVPPVRTDGDDTIVPVIEEVVVTRLFLKEEVRLHRVRTVRRYQDQITVREQEAVITRRAVAPPSTVDQPISNRNEETTMPSETILAVFETEAEAERAIAALEQQGVSRTSIEHYRKPADEGLTPDPVAAGTGLGRDRGEGFALGQEAAIGSEPPRRSGFWSWITGEPAAPSGTEAVGRHGDYYDRTIEHGRTIVTVVAESTEAERILSVLEAHSPIELEEHGAAAASTGMVGAGTAGFGATSTGTAATGTTVPGTVGTGATDEALTAAAGPTTPRFEDRTGTTEPPSSHGLRAETAAAAAPPTADASPARPTINGATGHEQTVPLAAEMLEVGKREVDRGTTRVRRYVVDRPVEEQVRLRDESVSVFRRPATGASTVGADAFTDRTVEMTETDEEAVVAKKAAVVEEVVIRKDVDERVETVRDNVRREEVEITGPDGKVETGKDTPPRI